jgi:hypothetical protein
VLQAFLQNVMVGRATVDFPETAQEMILGGHCYACQGVEADILEVVFVDEIAGEADAAVEFFAGRCLFIV